MLEFDLQSFHVLDGSQFLLVHQLLNLQIILEFLDCLVQFHEILAVVLSVCDE